MMYFWLCSIVLLIAAFAFIVLPLLTKKSNQDALLRDEMNKAFYKDRLSELEVEADEGIVDDTRVLVADLKQSLLDDIPQQSATKPSNLSPWVVFVPSTFLVVALSYFMYFHFGALDQVRHWQEVNSELPALSKKLMGPQSAQLSDQDMNDLTLALRTRLQYTPNDSTGWLLLGRLALANRNVEMAVGAMQKAYKLKPDDDDVRLGFAQALMMSGEPTDQDNARAILNQLVRQDKVDLRVFSLLAFDAFEHQKYQAAIRYWQVMQQLIGPKDSRYSMLERSIQSAKQKLAPADRQTTRVNVTITVDPSVTYPSNASLIVSIHKADGSPMPIAAARYPVGSFPRTVVLDDGNAMMDGQTLTDLKQIIVKARIDLDGDVASKSSDWFGQSQVVDIDKPVQVIINKQGN